MSPPQAFGPYELLHRVSAGGMAEVFRARDTRRGTIVALKRILPNVAMDEDFVTMFEDEAIIASQLEHPHIARTLDFGHVGTTYYIAFEFVDGKDMKVIFDRCVRANEHPPLWFLTYVFARIGEGLSYAHSRRNASGEPVSIVHRDVSPQNLVVSFGGDVKLIDFGIAKAAGKLSRTEVGAIKGKFGYMSPEQVRGNPPIDQRTDVFSLGICMWELLTLKRLFDAPNEVLVLAKIRDMEIQPPSSLNSEVPQALDRIVCKALAKDVDERYRSAKELYRDLNAVSIDTNTLATREQIAQYMRRTFPEGGPPPSSSSPGGGGSGHDLANGATPSSPSRAQEAQERVAMAADNKAGSDLDVFEGLGKRSSARPSGAVPAARKSAPPAPPPSMRPNGVPDATRGAPSGPPSAPPGGLLRSPPPPPGRGALPPVVAPPPSRVPPPPSSVSSSRPPAPPISAASPGPLPQPSSPPSPGAKPQGAVLDMEWDDENEATHVFDKEQSKSEMAPEAPPPSSSSMPVANKAPAATVEPKQTLLGVQSPFQAPPPPPPPPGRPSASPMRASAPPPPPSSVGGAFARASSIPSAAPGPVSFPPPPPAPMIDPRPSPMSQRPSQNPFVAQPELPPQVSTVPLSMPMLRTSAPPPSQMPSMPPPPTMNRMEATALVHPPQSRTGLFVGIATAAVVALASAFFLLPRKGEILVAATSAKGDAAHLEVYVDGKKTECGTSPCVVDEIAVGPHTVKVVAEGYPTAPDQTITVESHQQARANFTLLAPGDTAPAGSVGGTGVRVAGSQPNVKLYVDDKEIGPLPAEVRDLTPGSHKIRLAGGDRYAAVEKSVTVAQDELQDLGTTTLKVIKGKATISPGTPGAKVYIVSGTDRRELPTLPISVDIDTSKQWSLLATKSGFSDYTQPISFDDGQAEKTFTISLDAKPAAVAAAAAPEAPAPRPQQPFSQPAAAPHVAAAPHPAPAAASGGDTAPAPAPAAGEAFLNINSIPASSVVLDGKPIGNTPKLRYAVSAGSHSVMFVNSEQGFKKSISISVGAGETKPAIGRAD